MSVTYVASPNPDFRFGITDESETADIKQQLLDQIAEYEELARSPDLEPEPGMASFRLDEITEFYFPKLSIEGYRLCRAVIDKWSFGYYYAPIEKLGDGEYVFEFGDGFLLGIDRKHRIDTNAPIDSHSGLRYAKAASLSPLSEYY